MSDDAADPTPDESEASTEGGPVERAFTCTVCGFATTYESGELQTDVRATCLNCGDWTVQTAALADVVAAARDVADRLAGDVLTERQALAYLLRERVGIERATAAEAMDTSPSNVDNLHRRGREKVEDARRIVEELDRLGVGDDGAEADRAEQ